VIDRCQIGAGLGSQSGVKFDTDDLAWRGYSRYDCRVVTEPATNMEHSISTLQL
jgi:hypothetical protein